MCFVKFRHARVEKKPLICDPGRHLRECSGAKCPYGVLFECCWAAASECPKECFLSVFWRFLVPRGMTACTCMAPTLAKPWSGTMVLKSPSSTIYMFFSTARWQGGDFQDHGSEGVQTTSRPWFCEGGDHAGTGDHAASEKVPKKNSKSTLWGTPRQVPKKHSKSIL